MPDKPKVCDQKASDSGKQCTDSTQCEGVCVAPQAAEPGRQAGGQCSPYLLNFGTMTLVEKGIVKRIAVE